MKTLVTILLFVGFTALAHAQETGLSPTDLISQVPEGLLKYAPHFWITVFVLRRAWQNWKTGGGWYGLRRAALWGEKTPDAKAADDAKVAQKLDAIEERRAAVPPPTT